MSSTSALKQTWSSLSPAQRRIIPLVALGVLVAVLFWAGSYGRGPAYATLFAGLDPRDAAEVVAQLERDGTSYRLEQGGTKVLVPEKEVHRVRLALAAGGLPRGGVVGFEIVDQARLGTTDFDRRVNYMRALQGELTRTILQIDGVENARVHLALPEPSLFVEQQKPVTAAVMVKLRPLAELDRSQVRGITHLVSRSVEGLRAENVTIVDFSGRILSSEVGEAGTAGPAGAATLEVQQGFQYNLERQLQALLETVLGRGNVVCRVNAELNFDQTTIMRSLFEPTGDGSGLARSVQQLEETFEGTAAAGVGAPGTATNVPTYPTTAGSNGDSSYQRRETTQNFELNQTEEHTVIAPGAVKRLSVAVVVNSELTPAQETAITDTVAAAVGYDPARNDRITVAGMPFDTTLVDELRRDMVRQAEAEEQARRQTRLYTLIAAGVGGVLLLVLLIVALATAGRRRPRAAATGAPPGAETPPARTEPELDLDAVTNRRSQGGVVKLARRNPEAVAQLLKTWLAEEART